MKRFLIVVAFALLGFAAAYINASYFTELWINLGLRQAISQWLSGYGLESAVGIWSIVWTYLPEWTIAIIVGILLRLLFGASMPLYGISFCVGFSLIPQVQFIADRDMWVFGAEVMVSSFIWSLNCFPILLIAGSIQLRRPLSKRSFHFSILRLLILTVGFAVVFVVLMRWRLIGLPCVLLGTLIAIAYSTLRDLRGDNQTPSQ